MWYAAILAPMVGPTAMETPSRRRTSGSQIRRSWLMQFLVNSHKNNYKSACHWLAKRLDWVPTIQPSCVKPYSEQFAMRPRRSGHTVSWRPTRSTIKNQFKTQPLGVKSFKWPGGFLTPTTAKALNLSDTDNLYGKDFRACSLGDRPHPTWQRCQWWDASLRTFSSHIVEPLWSITMGASTLRASRSMACISHDNGSSVLWPMAFFGTAMVILKKHKSSHQQPQNQTKDQHQHHPLLSVQ